MNNRYTVGVNVGSISLMVIYLVLCLSVFSMLSLSTAHSEMRLAEKSARAAADFYAADLVCTEKAGQLSRMLGDGASLTEINNLALSLDATVTVVGEAMHIEFSQQIMPGQELVAVLALADGKMSVLSWRAVDVGPWQPDNTIRVWEGDQL